MKVVAGTVRVDSRGLTFHADVDLYVVHIVRIARLPRNSNLRVIGALDHVAAGGQVHEHLPSLNERALDAVARGCRLRPG